MLWGLHFLFFHFAESILYGSIVVFNVVWISDFSPILVEGLGKFELFVFCDCFRASHALFFFFLQTCWGLWIIVWIQAFLFLLVSLGSLNFPVVRKFELFGFLIVLLQVMLCLGIAVVCVCLFVFAFFAGPIALFMTSQHQKRVNSVFWLLKNILLQYFSNKFSVFNKIRGI